MKLLDAHCHLMGQALSGEEGKHNKKGLIFTTAARGLWGLLCEDAQNYKELKDYINLYTKGDRWGCFSMIMDLGYTPLKGEKMTSAARALHKVCRKQPKISPEFCKEMPKELTDYYPPKQSCYCFPIEDEYIKKCVEAHDKLNTGSKRTVYVFAPFDPRRDGWLTKLKDWWNENKIDGVKLYSRCGWSPYPKFNDNFYHRDVSKKINDALSKFYEWAQRESVPMVCHTSPTGWPADYDLIYPKNYVGAKNSKIADKSYLENTVSPKVWKKVLAKWPNLRLCFAHMGGDISLYHASMDKHGWDKSTKDNAEKYRFTKDWTEEIIKMMVSYPNVYGDLSFVSSVDKEYKTIANTLDNLVLNYAIGKKNISSKLHGRKRRHSPSDIINGFYERLMYGSDWYLTTRYKWMAEKNYVNVVNVWADLYDKARWERISYKNAVNFINI